MTHYKDIADMIGKGMKYFKTLSAAKQSEEQLRGSNFVESADLAKGIQKWFTSEQRQNMKTNLAQMAKDKVILCSSQYVQFEEFMHTEMVVSSPFRNIVWKGFPYKALVEASQHPGWDPTNVNGRDDDNLETIVEDGLTFRVTADITRPPPSLACIHQTENPNCTCPRACPPCGFNVLLTWDKGQRQMTKKNRHLHIPREQYDMLCDFTSLRDRFFSTYVRNGPSGNEQEDWYKGTCRLFLNSTGRSNNFFSMAMASRVMEMQVTAHMFRKHYCTFLAHHQDESVRAAQPQVCGQSTSIFQQYYNLNTRKDAQTLVQILQQWRSPEESVNDEQREAENRMRLEAEIERVNRIDEEIEQTEELIDTQSFKHPIMKAQLALLLKLATRIDKDIIVSHPQFSEVHREALGVAKATPEVWKRKLIKLAMLDIDGAESLRKLLLDIFNGRDDPIKHKWSVRESMFERRENAKQRGKCDDTLEDPLWVLLDTLLSSLRSKLKPPTSTKKKQQTMQQTPDSLEYNTCVCQNLGPPFECIHCNMPVCNRCCRFVATLQVPRQHQFDDERCRPGIYSP